MTRCLLIVVALTLGLTASVAAEERLIDGIAAQVGGDIVLVSEVLESVAPVEAKMREAGLPDAEIAKLRAAGLEKLIETRLIEQVVRRTELYASDSDVDQAIDAIARNNGITRDQLEETVVAQGLTIEDYREQIKGELERRKVINMMVASKVHIEESEVRSLYDERFSRQPAGGEMVHLRQILVTFAGAVPKDESATCSRVVEARDRILAGEAFEKVAAEISEVAPAQGGDIGWLHIDSLAHWMSRVVDSLQDGETSDVIKLAFGCSLLKLVERRGFEPMTYEAAKEELQQEIYETHLEREFRAWMETLRQETFIDRKGYFADAAKLGSQSGFAEEPGVEAGPQF